MSRAITVVARVAESLTRGRVRFLHKAGLPAGTVESLRWFWLPWRWAERFGHGGWVFLDRSWMRRNWRPRR